MKKFALVLVLMAVTPIASAAAQSAPSDFWAWVASFFASDADTENARIQDESRSFNSIIR